MLIKQKTTPPVSNNQNGRLDFPTMTAEKCLNISIMSSIVLQIFRLQDMANHRRQNKIHKFNNLLFNRPTIAPKFSEGNANIATKTSKARKYSSSINTFRHRIQRLFGGHRLRNFLDNCKQILDFLLHPVIMLILFILTVRLHREVKVIPIYSILFQAFTILMVTINSLQLLFGFRDLPVYVQYVEEYRHALGIFGAIIEVTIILFVFKKLIKLYISFQVYYDVLIGGHLFHPNCMEDKAKKG
jgi:hypothetical protein